MAGMYAVYHGPEGLKAIATRIHAKTAKLAAGLDALGYKITTEAYFDTITDCPPKLIRSRSHPCPRRRRRHQPSRRSSETEIGISLDETTTEAIIKSVWDAFSPGKDPIFYSDAAKQSLPADLARTSAFLTHPSLQPVPLRDRDPPLHAPPRRPRPRARPRHDPSWLLHHEAERHHRDASYLLA